MTYATLQNLTERYGADMLLGITDRATPPAGVIDVVVVERALANADATINGRLGTRFVVPLAETPPEIREIAEAIAIWKLHVYKPDEKIEADYKEAMKTLEGMAAGSVVLHATTLAPVETGGTGARLCAMAAPGLATRRWAGPTSPRRTGWCASTATRSTAILTGCATGSAF